MEDMSKRRARLLEWSLTIAIVVVLNLLFNVGLQLVVKEPRYDTFCPQEQVQPTYTTKEACLNVGGQWVEGNEATPRGAVYQAKPIPTPVLETSPDASVGAPTSVETERRGYCNPYFTCQKNFEEAQKVYNRNVFLALVTAGALSLLLGFFLTASTAVSLGFTWGGVLSLVIGSVRYWSDMNEYLRFVLLLIVLCVLVWLGIKKLRDVTR